MDKLDALLALPPFALGSAEKRADFAAALAQLTALHRDGCPGYGRILEVLGFDPDAAPTVEDFPFLPARLFKRHRLQSVPDDVVRTVLTSSGTSGQMPSRIALDAVTSALQTRILARIVGDFIGKARLPMLVVDAASTIRSRSEFSARAAGILGFSMFGRDVTYALADDMTPDWAAIDGFLDRHGGGPMLVFGFTFMVWAHLIQPLRAAGRLLPLENGVLVHGGGWKKLADHAVDDAAFRRHLAEVAGLSRVHNYYGMVEQTGSIFMQCEAGHLHCPVYCDVIIRDADFAALPMGARGLVELVSLLPRSYPGHVLLTEDEGTIDGQDDCPCGRPGKYFRVHGRTAMAEIRGCSDTYAEP
ncbi:MAG TPA: long-chain fatty acid--CoA ligase [Magnetospirillum sp.]|nr:long-chain fatty acid--CoA ligase [Magnetospirillum sp.]